MKTDKSQDYLILTGHRGDLRNDLGLPERGLYAGDQLMRWTQHLCGIHSEYLYCSRDQGTVAEMHREDGDLHSANILYAGNPKLWVFISPCSRNALEYHLQKRFGISADCSQFVRHLHCLPSPSQLREWGIVFSTRRQYPGDLVLVLPDVYHYIINEGINLAGAINYTEPGWQLNHLYTDCANRCAGDDSIPLKRLASSVASKPRSLDVDGDFELPRPKRPNSNTLDPNSHQKKGHPWSGKSSRRKLRLGTRSNRYQVDLNDAENKDECQSDQQSNDVSTSEESTASSTALSSLESTPEAPTHGTEQETLLTISDKTNASGSCLQLIQDPDEGNQVTVIDPQQGSFEKSCEESRSSSANTRARSNSASGSVPHPEVPIDINFDNNAEISKAQSHNLELLKWSVAFQTFRREADISAGTIYRLMALASLPGNVDVLERLQSILCEARDCRILHAAPVSSFSALWNHYTLAMSHSAFFKLEQAFSELQIIYDYQQRETRLRQKKKAENCGKSHQVQEINQSNKRIATLVIDEIEQENGFEGDSNFRRKYNRAKKNGLAILSLKELFGIPEENLRGLILLLPTEATPCSLDDHIEADIKT